jgi:putative membrane protein
MASDTDKRTAQVERQEIKKAAGHISQASGQIAASTDRATQLAADRTMFAAERTYAAWVRTGLAALASGIAAKVALKEVLPDLGIRLAGSVLVLFSAFCFGAAIWRQLFNPAPPPDVERIPGFVLYRSMVRWPSWRFSPYSVSGSPANLARQTGGVGGNDETVRRRGAGRGHSLCPSR